MQMRKTLLLVVTAAMIFSGSSNAADSFGDKLILYVPNRAVDFADMFSVCAGFGPSIKGQFWVTRFMSFGGGIGSTAKLVKEYNRQYGAGLQSGWSASFGSISAEDSEMTETSRGVQSYFQYRTGVPSLDEDVYSTYDGARDIFAIGGEGACFAEFCFELHPFDIADFFTGLFFVDIKGDDFGSADLKN